MPYPKYVLFGVLFLLFVGCSYSSNPEAGTSLPTTFQPTASVTYTFPPPAITDIPSLTSVPIEETTIPSPTGELVLTTAPTDTPLPPSPTPLPPASYSLQAGTPLGMPNIVDPAAGCNWMGVAGQVFNQKGEAVIGMVIEVGGVLDGKSISQMGVTGGAPSLGPGGYAITISDHPIASDGSLWVQLFDQAGNPKTGKILLTTYADCDRNQILVNLVELPTPTYRVNLPLVADSTR